MNKQLQLCGKAGGGCTEDDLLGVNLPNLPLWVAPVISVVQEVVLQDVELDGWSGNGARLWVAVAHRENEVHALQYQPLQNQLT